MYAFRSLCSLIRNFSLLLKNLSRSISLIKFSNTLILPNPEPPMIEILKGRSVIYSQFGLRFISIDSS